MSKHDRLLTNLGLLAPPVVSQGVVSYLVVDNAGRALGASNDERLARRMADDYTFRGVTCQVVRA